MNFIGLELFMIAFGLSMDACAVGICAGLTAKKSIAKKALTVGLYFGIFQAVMPLIGYFAASVFADKIIAYDHWVAFVLLCFLGGKMIKESFEEDKDEGKEISLSPVQMLPLSVATSIDALAVGVSFAFLKVEIVPAACVIGGTTFLLSAFGVVIGKMAGEKLKSKAEFTGGVILILIGVKILLEHLDIFKI